MKAAIKFWKRGEPLVWLTGAAQFLVMFTVIALIFIIVIEGGSVFWAKDIERYSVENKETDSKSIFMGELQDANIGPRGSRVKIKSGNRDLDPNDFKWLDNVDIVKHDVPQDALVLERMKHGHFYGFLQSIEGSKATGAAMWQEFEEKFQIMREQRDKYDSAMDEQGEFADTLRDVRYELEVEDKESAHYKELVAHEKDILNKQEDKDKEIQLHKKEMERDKALFKTAGGIDVTYSFSSIYRYYQPNQMGVLSKTGLYLTKAWELVWEDPREANTEGGVFPAIIGTVMLVFLMSMIAFPMGVMAGVYLAEYAKEGTFVKIVRVAVNNLAGIPSIVYGIFGLGFFIYFVGDKIDLWFYDRPTFKSAGILWASLTLSILTLPVVIVNTEEALRTVPQSLKHASLAMGATRFQTLVKILLPAAAPGILTGFILSIARAAGEVAPLMLTGAMKTAQDLPIDGSFPFLHLERRFMHLGFHIYDIGFQSPNVEATKPMVYVTSFLLVGIVLVMSLFAMRLRQKLKDRLISKHI